MKSTKYIIRNGKNIIAISHGIDLAIWICDKFGTEVTKQCKLKGNEMKQGIDIDGFEKKANEIIANVGKKETLEEAAKEYEAKTNYSKYVMFDAFIAGAKSDAAKDYWFNQFKNKIK